jgi:Tol biopolymer transport system component/DNA-binding winged helix-turn-helix (wHTH) protein
VTYQFADVSVDLERVVITRNGVPVEIEPKAFDVLRHLLEHADRLVTKEELLDAIWGDTFVTPNVLTRAIAQLRRELGDDAREARYIGTVARRGYRFIAPVTMTSGAVPTETRTQRGTPGERDQSRSRLLLVAAIALFAVAAGGAAFIVRVGVLRRSVPLMPAPSRLITHGGNNTTPTLSPEGRAAAFVSDRTGSMEIYVVGIAPGSEEVAITNDSGQNMQPDWSPDGRWIAFHSRRRGGIWIVPSTGGAPQQIVERGSNAAWSPDSERLVYTPDEGGTAGQQVLWTVRRDGTDRRQLTQLGLPAGGHNHPVWSRNGRFIAFVVSNGLVNNAIWIVDAAGGAPRLLTSAGTADHPQFAPDDAAIYWTGKSASSSGRLFRIGFDAATGTSVGDAIAVMPFENGALEGLSIARNGSAAFGVGAADANLWTVDLARDGRVSEPARLTDEAVRSGRPVYSRDGRIAFLQFGAGLPLSVWSMDEDGSHRMPLLPETPAGAPSWSGDGRRVLVLRGGGAPSAGVWWVDPASRRATPTSVSGGDIRSPRLAPDSQSIAFHAIDATGAMNVWTQRLDGGPRRRVTNDREAISYPVWSPDGHWLALEVKRGERTQIGVVPSAGGAIELLTADAGQSWPHSWSPDGERILYAAEREAVWNIWEVSRRTRAERQLTHFTSSSGYVRYPTWSPRGSRIVFERETHTATIWTVQLAPSGERLTTND